MFLLELEGPLFPSLPDWSFRADVVFLVGDPQLTVYPPLHLPAALQLISGVFTLNNRSSVFVPAVCGSPSGRWGETDW